MPSLKTLNCIMNQAHLLIGGNVGDTIKNLQQAIELLNRHCGTVIQQSSVYKTAPWGKADQQDFLNQAVLLLTPFSAKELMDLVLNVEATMGRKRAEKYGPRIVDIDILFFNDAIIREPGLIIPHPELQNRRFALVPLEEIASAFIHPVLCSSVHDLLLNCPDQLKVSLYL